MTIAAAIERDPLVQALRRRLASDCTPEQTDRLNHFLDAYRFDLQILLQPLEISLRPLGQEALERIRHPRQRHELQLERREDELDELSGLLLKTLADLASLTDQWLDCLDDLDAAAGREPSFLSPEYESRASKDLIGPERSEGPSLAPWARGHAGNGAANRGFSPETASAGSGLSTPSRRGRLRGKASGVESYDRRRTASPSRTGSPVRPVEGTALRGDDGRVGA